MLKKFTLILVLLFSLTGCGTTKIESNRDLSYQQKIDHVLVSLSLETSNTGLNSTLVETHLRENLEKYGISVQVIIQIVNEPAISMEAKLKRAVTSYNPNQVLSLTIATIRELNGGAIGFDVDASLVDMKLHKKVWRSSISPVGIFKNATREKSIADAVVQKFAEDGLLPTR